MHVAVDGQPQGTTPSELVLREGSHRLELDREGYQPISSAIIVHAGERKELDLKLKNTGGAKGSKETMLERALEIVPGPGGSRVLAGGAGLLPERASPYVVKLQWRREGRRWQLARLDWQ